MNLSLAWRNVWRNKTRSFIIMISVAIGLFAGILVLGIYKGMMQARVRTVIDTEVAHLQIHHPVFRDDYEPGFVIDNAFVEQTLRKKAYVKAFAVRTVTQGMLSTPTASAGVQIYGVSMKSEEVVSRLDNKIHEGDSLIKNKRSSVLIGKKLADKMKLKVGSKLVLTFTDIESNIVSGAFRITGIYKTDNTPLDERDVYVNRAALDYYLGIKNSSHEVAVILLHDDLIETAKNDLVKEFPDYRIETWKENSPETDLMVSTIDQYTGIIIMIIMIALAFGIINTMLMSVLERTREIGMLTALGMNRARVFLLILTETVLLTTVGVPVGLVASWFTINSLGNSGIDISSFSGAAMSGFGFSSMIYPEFPVDSLRMVMTIVIGTALVSSIFPSLKAIKLQPADALRR